MEIKKNCKICDKAQTSDTVFHSHHIIPRSKGGTDDKDNLIDICSDCHHNIHYPNKKDGDTEHFNDEYETALAHDIFVEGWGIIPIKLSHDPKISSFAKILYSDISSLCAQRGYCWASNKYFAEVFGVSDRTISRAIVELEPFLMIRNRLSGQRKIWVHQLNTTAPKKVQEKKKSGKDTNVPTKKKKESKATKDDRMLAELLLSKILFNFPAYENKKVSLDEWAEDIRRLREIDSAKVEQIGFMIHWVHGGDYAKNGQKVTHFAPHDFWAQNILSASKLRKQWFSLIPQLQKELKKDIKNKAVGEI